MAKWRGFLVSATINHFNIFLKFFYVFSTTTYCSISVSGNVMTFPAKKVKVFSLKSAFIFLTKKLKIVQIFILQGRKNIETVYDYSYYYRS